MGRRKERSRRRYGCTEESWRRVSSPRLPCRRCLAASPPSSPRRERRTASPAIRRSEHPGLLRSRRGRETTLPVGVEEDLADGSRAEGLRVRSIEDEEMVDDGLRIAISLGERRRGDSRRRRCGAACSRCRPRSGGGVSTGEVASLECVGDRTLGVGVDSAVRPRWRTHLAFAMAIRV